MYIQRQTVQSRLDTNSECGPVLGSYLGFRCRLCVEAPSYWSLQLSCVPSRSIYCDQLTCLLASQRRFVPSRSRVLGRDSHNGSELNETRLSRTFEVHYEHTSSQRLRTMRCAPCRSAADRIESITFQSSYSSAMGTVQLSVATICWELNDFGLSSTLF